MGWGEFAFAISGFATNLPWWPKISNTVIPKINGKYFVGVLNHNTYFTITTLKPLFALARLIANNFCVFG